MISAPIEVEIASLLEGQADPTKFRDIKGVVDIPQEKIEKEVPNETTLAKTEKD